LDFREHRELQDSKDLPDLAARQDQPAVRVLLAILEVLETRARLAHRDLPELRVVRD